jgi:hypothetical protein
MLPARSLSRCGACGATLPAAATTLGACPGCQAAIHACRQCTHFDTGRRFECAEPVPERVADKNARNDCASFALRVTVERDASPHGARPVDARRAFDDLFRP